MKNLSIEIACDECILYLSYIVCNKYYYITKRMMYDKSLYKSEYDIVAEDVRSEYFIFDTNEVSIAEKR